MAQQQQATRGNQQRGNAMQDYVTVAERIEKFYREHPQGRIITHILEHDSERGFILMRAEIYRNTDDAQPAATGHAYEYRDAGFVQKTSYIEVCETSSVGRALALCGFEVKRGIASREEMQKQERMSGQQGSQLREVKPSQPATAPQTTTPNPTWRDKVFNKWKALYKSNPKDFGSKSQWYAHLKNVARSKGWDANAINNESDLTEKQAETYYGVLCDLESATT